MGNAEEHSIYSPSSAHRWLNCPGSISAEKGYVNTSSNYAQLGVALHKLAEAYLNNNHDSKLNVGEAIGGVTLTSDHINIVKEYVKYVRSLIINDSELNVEFKVRYESLVTNGYGTVDAVIINYVDKICHIIDFKSGMTPVYAKYNNQLILYAIGVMLTNNITFTIEKYILHIAQPSINNYSTYELSNLEILAEMLDISKKIQLTKVPNAPRIPGVKQCKYCLAKYDCDARHKIYKELEVLLNPIRKLTTKEKKKILDTSDEVINLISDIKSEVQSTLENGGEFQGYTLERTKGKRTWDQDKLREFKTEVNLYEKKLIGIGVGDKLLGKNVVNSLTTLSSGPLKLKRIKGEI